MLAGEPGPCASPMLSPALLCWPPQPLLPPVGHPHTPSLLAGLEPVAQLGQAAWEKLATFPEDSQGFGLHVCF